MKNTVEMILIMRRNTCDRGKGVPSFDEMVAIVLEEVDFDDPTTNVKLRSFVLLMY